MKKYFVIIALFVCIQSMAQKPKLIWSDEFNEVSISKTNWVYDIGGNGWGNNELECYTNRPDNSKIEKGNLLIIAKKESFNGKSYTSARLKTEGLQNFTYGKIEARMKVPIGQGMWPAFWMLGKNIATANWPKCGEIDIMELIGNTPSIIYGTAHWNNNGHVSRGNSFTLSGGKFSSGFHVFSLRWTPNRLIWLVDNQQYSNLSRSEISAFPFDLPQFFIFNVAVGGNWPGVPDQTTVFPQNMIVDYIRVYQ